ncbi:methyltransferase domain-containing protein [Oleiharenicola sp. Vm1]|uniref:methyltransferase domain-containing protein n=1 Tax=Oleiharenicola sp. Vm1 TaxID=3398393 RepID=UPI0039F5AFFB
MIRFTCQGQAVTLAPGEHFSRPRELGFRDTPATELLELVAELERGTPWRDAVARRFAGAKPWLHAIVASSTRTAFIGPVLPSETTGPVLDIGAGWGQLARPLAATRRVLALEPVAERLAFIRAAARQDGVDGNLSYLEADYFEVEFAPQFAAICAIGVLEWVGAFQAAVDPQARQVDFLRKVRRELAPGGMLVLGIENRLGLKYLLGCPDDHIGVPDIAQLPARLAAMRWQQATQGTLRSFTYSLDELRRLLLQAGFERVEFFAAFPDYKLPRQIISLADGGAALHAWLLAHPIPPEHNGYDGSPLPAAFQQTLAARYHELATQGVARHFAPSFFVRAT